MDIAEVRSKYPQYSDLSDADLVKGLHGKFYSDMPYDQFAAKVGLTKETKTDPQRTQAAIGGVNRGLAGLAGLPVDTVENIVNLGLAAYGSAKTAITGKPGPDLLHGSVGGSDYLAGKLQDAGINTQNPSPQDAPSRMLYTGGKVVGGSMVPGAQVGSTLASAAGAAVAGELGGPQWEGVGAMVPGAAMQAGGTAKRAIADPATVQKNQTMFREAGTTPDVAQVTESNFLRGLTNVVSRIPGGQGIITKFRESEQKNLGASAATGVSAEKAGKTIREGIEGEGGFLDRTKATWQRLDSEVAAKIPAGTGFTPTETVSALDALTTPTQGALKTTAGLVNPKLAEIRKNLADDLQANNGQVPFEALRALRSRIGSMLDESLVSGIPNGELKQVYKGLSKDLEAAANQAGAGREFQRQQTYYKARMDRIESTLDGLIGNNRTPEGVLKALSPTSPEEVTKIRRVFRSLSDSERETVSQAVVNRLGRATPGKQNADGDVFSSDTFLTNWSKISEPAKAQLFPDAATRRKVEAIAGVSSSIRDSNKVFSNASGTGGAVSAGTVYSAPVVALAAKTVVPLAAAGGLVVGANIGAKMLTSPAVIDWLAKSSKTATPQQASAQLGRLAVIYNSTKDEALKSELGDYMNSLNGK